MKVFKTENKTKEFEEISAENLVKDIIALLKQDAKSVEKILKNKKKMEIDNKENQHYNHGLV